MIGIYYTNSEFFLQSQLSPLVSIGGFISNTLVPNEWLNNIFGDVSELNVANPSQDVRALAIKNETGTDISNLQIWIEPAADSLIDIEIGIVAPAIDSCGNQYLFKLPNGNASPYGVTFISANGQVNAAVIGSFPEDSYLGLWIRRKVNATLANQQRTCDALYDNFTNNVMSPTQQQFSLEFEW